MTEKRCSKCGEVKGVDCFSRDKNKKDGLQCHCRKCRVENARRYREKNIEKVAEKNRRYREENREKLAEYALRYREENPEKMAEANRRYYEENREKLAEKNRRFREENREKLAEYARMQIGLITDSYVARVMKIPTAEAPPDLIEAKRQQLKLKRTIKNAKEIRHGSTRTKDSASKQSTQATDGRNNEAGRI